MARPCVLVNCYEDDKFVMHCSTCKGKHFAIESSKLVRQKRDVVGKILNLICMDCGTTASADYDYTLTDEDEW